TFSDSSTQQLASVTWSSSNPAVVSITDDVTDEGSAYALAPGSATVSACTGAVCGSTTVTVAAPVVGLTAATLIFVAQSVGTTSSSQMVTLNNIGNATLSIGALLLTGTNPGDFSQTNTCGSSVAAGGSCTISVTFTPTAPGARSASVAITDTATSSPQAVSLIGTGTAPLAGVTAASLTFSSQNLGTTSAAQTVTLNNTGNVALSITSIAFSGANPGDFGQTNTCGSSLAASGSCTI